MTRNTRETPVAHMRLTSMRSEPWSRSEPSRERRVCFGSTSWSSRPYSAARAERVRAPSRLYVCKLPTLKSLGSHTARRARTRYGKGSGAKRVSFQCFTCRRRARQLGAGRGGNEIVVFAESFFMCTLRPPQPLSRMIFAVSETATAEASTSICSARIDAAGGQTRDADAHPEKDVEVSRVVVTRRA